MDNWLYQSQLSLAAMPNASYWARRHTEDMLAKWGCESLVTNAQLVITELVTNAVRETGTLDLAAQQKYAQQPLDVGYVELAGAGTVRLRLSYDTIRLLAEVWDSSDQPPIMQTPDLVSENGRGLYIVAVLCERWGWYPTKGGGKVVWVELVKPPHPKG